MNKCVVIFAPSDDLHALVVARRLDANHSVRAVILDAADYPLQWALDLRPCSQEFTLQLQDQTEIHSSDIVGVWYRRFKVPRKLDQIRDQPLQEFAATESRLLLQGIVNWFGRRSINPLAAEIRSVSKAFQLLQATRVGLQVPETLLSTNPDVVRSFWRKHKNVVFKATSAVQARMTETRLLEGEHFAHGASMRLAPTIFQVAILPKTDLRITIVDQEVFCASIVPIHPQAMVDWRLDAATQIAPYTLPDDIRHKLIDYQEAMGLRFGAIDMCVDSDGQYFFLEVNTSGQFLFVEIHAELPISAAVAKALVQGVETP